MSGGCFQWGPTCRDAIQVIRVDSDGTSWFRQFLTSQRNSGKIFVRGFLSEEYHEESCSPSDQAVCRDLDDQELIQRDGHKMGKENSIQSQY